MTSNTDDLIRHLADNVERVRPLAQPWKRAAVWMGLSAVWLVLLYLAWPHASAPARDPRFAIEQAAALLTGVTAAIAAFSLTVPGRSRTIAFVPLVPLGVWLLTVGQGCAREWSGTVPLPPLLPHWGCLAATIAAGIAPATLMVFMLRRGAPLSPRLTTLLVAIAAAGLANVCVRFVHVFDSSFVVLAWHVGAVMALGAVLACGGKHVFNWRTVVRAN